MESKQAKVPFQLDPSDFVVFRERVKEASHTDPLAKHVLQEVLIEAEGIYRLPGVLRRNAPGLKKLLLVMDKTSMLRDGTSLKPLVADILVKEGFQVLPVELEGDRFGVVHPNFEQVEIVHAQIHPDTVVIGLGSGVVTDICKYACFLFDNEHKDQRSTVFISVPTANSVPAYASSMAIISKDGVKRTWPTRLPNVILCDLKVLRDCPKPLNLGGIGDMCAMYIASVEWYLGMYMGVVPDTPAARLIVDEAKPLLIEYANEIGKQSLSGMEMMAKILTLGGLAMTFAGDSTPMSGYEHGVAHLLDMGADYFQRPVRNHGSQVAVAGIFVLTGLERFLNELDPAVVKVEQCYPSAEEMQKRIQDVFGEIDPSGAMGAECWRDYQKKLIIWSTVRPKFEVLLKEWPDVVKKMRELSLPTKTYLHLLHDAGHPLTFEELGVKEKEARWAYRNAYMLRKRLSTTDLMIFMNWMDEGWVDWVFAEAKKQIAAELNS